MVVHTQPLPCMYTHLLSVPGIIIRAFYMLIHLLLKTTVSGRYSYYLYFTDGETEAQRGFDLPEATQIKAMGDKI